MFSKILNLFKNIIEKRKAIKLKKTENKTILRELFARQKFLSYHNIQKIISLKNKYLGEKCFIIGGSPSLNELDLTKLNSGKYKIFTTGKSYKLKDKGLEHSDFHILADPSGYKEIINEFDNNFCDILFSPAGIDIINTDVKELIYFQIVPSKGGKSITLKDHYQEDLTKSIFDCETVIGFALQIATYLGFKEIYFIGVDLDFQNSKGHAYKSTNGEIQRQQKHSYKNQGIMLDGLEGATKFLETKNIKLYNASPKGILNCMPRVNYDTLF